MEKQGKRKGKKNGSVLRDSIEIHYEKTEC